MLFQAVEQHRVARPGCRGLVHHDHVHPAQELAVVPERFPDHALQPVASGAQTAVLFANGKPEPGCFTTVRSTENGKHVVAAALRLFEDATNRVLVQETIDAPEAMVGWGAACRFAFRNWRVKPDALRRELRPTLRATTLQHEPARFGRHPRSESVGASPLDFAGLKCSFHLNATWL